VTNDLTPVTRLADGTWSVGVSRGVAISANGRYVSFAATATNLVAPPLETDSRQLWRFDRATGAIELASIGATGLLEGLMGRWTSLSADGRWLVFVTDAPNLVAFNTNGLHDVLVRTYGSSVSGDVNSDGVTDATDLAALIGAWGTIDQAADLDGDGTVGPLDLGILLGGWTGS